MTKAAVVGAMMLLALTSCQSTQARRGTGYPVHVVVCWLKTPGDDAARQKIIDVSRSFASIPGVVKVAAGRAMPSERPVVDDSFDVTIVIAFKNEAALRAYDTNPAHRKAAEETLRPLVGKMVIHDFLDE